jgi:hypothetical protein
MDTDGRLVAIEDIKRLKARYCRCVDTKDWDDLANTFTPNAVFNVDWTELDDAPENVIRGNRAIVDYVRSQIDVVTTVHHCHMPEIDVTSPTTASGVWAMEDMLWWPGSGPLVSMHGYGHYHETYEKIDGEWRIATFALARLRVDFDN